MNRKNIASFVLGTMSVVAFCTAILLGTVSCGSPEPFERQEVLLSFPELSSITVGQTHPFVVGLNLPAMGIETLSAQSEYGLVRISPDSHKFIKGENIKTFDITAIYPGEDIVTFCLGRRLCESMPVWIFNEPEF
jgi:hypothetical protein